MSYQHTLEELRIPEVVLRLVMGGWWQGEGGENLEMKTFFWSVVPVNKLVSGLCNSQ